MKLRWHQGKEPRALADDGTEVWTKVPDASRYAVSNMGRVASSAQGKWKLMTLSTHGAGYRSVGVVTDEGKSTTFLVHRLAVLAFDGPPPTPEHTEVRHLDGDKGNNALSNLLHGTKSENMLDVLRHRQAQEEAVRAGRIEDAEKEGVWYGGRTWDSELVELLFVMRAEGHLTLTNVARILDVGRDVVQNMALGRSHAHLDLAKTKKQKRRTKAQKDAIMALVREGKNAKEINEELGETLTPQGVNYYRTKVKAEA